MDSQPRVSIVDDDASVRRALARLLKSTGHQVETFASAGEFLARDQDECPGCVVLDVDMPGLSGLGLQEKLAAEDRPLPIVFITGHGDIPMSVRAMKAGAVDFLPKPVSDLDLLTAIRQALDQDRQARKEWAEGHEIRRRVQTLTPRERQVLELVVTGLMNKHIAARLGTGQQTIKVHRGHVMEKMQARSLPELVRMAEKVGIAPPTVG